MHIHRSPTIILSVVVVFFALLPAQQPLSAQGTDISIVPFLDGETKDPTEGFSLNRFGGATVQGTQATIAPTTSVVRSGARAFEIKTNGAIPQGGFDFIGLSLTGFGPSVAYVDTRDITGFKEVRFWIQ